MEAAKVWNKYRELKECLLRLGRAAVAFSGGVDSLLLLVAAREGEVLGYATSSVFRPRAAYDRTIETSIYLRDGATGLRLGTRLYAALFAAIAGEDIHRMLAVVAIPNDASVALHTSFGFREVGRLNEVGRKFDRWWDVVFLEKRVEDSPLGA